MSGKVRSKGAIAFSVVATLSAIAATPIAYYIFFKPRVSAVDTDAVI
jgi:hypothetical protein